MFFTEFMNKRMSTTGAVLVIAIGGDFTSVLDQFIQYLVPDI